MEGDVGSNWTSARRVGGWEDVMGWMKIGAVLLWAVTAIAALRSVRARDVRRILSGSRDKVWRLVVLPSMVMLDVEITQLAAQLHGPSGSGAGAPAGYDRSGTVIE